MDAPYGHGHAGMAGNVRPLLSPEIFGLLHGLAVEPNLVEVRSNIWGDINEILIDRRQVTQAIEIAGAEADSSARHVVEILTDVSGGCRRLGITRHSSTVHL